MDLSKLNLLKSYNEVHELAKNEYILPSKFIKKFTYENQIVIIDLMNLCVSNSNEIRPKYLWKIIHEIFDESLSKPNFEKEYREYTSFAFFTKKIEVQRFIKTDKPDFIIIVDDKIIDLEVRSVIDEKNAQLNKIGFMQFGRSRNELELKTYVNNKHKRLCWDKYYKNISGINVIQSKSYSSNEFTQMLVSSLLRKNKQVSKYQSKNEKWLLLDTEDSPWILDDNDLKQFEIDVSKIKNDINNIRKLFIIHKLAKYIYEYDFLQSNLTNDST
jgi:hypothetical protein